MRSFLFITTILIGSLMSSCNLDKDDDDDLYTYPDLTATVTVTGAVIDGFTFTNAENSEAGSAYALYGSHSGADSMILIAGNSASSTYSITATLPTIQTGTFNLTEGSYLNTAGAQPEVFTELVGGSLTITSADLLWAQGVGQVYSIDGTWSMEMEEDASPAQAITLTCAFNNLVIISVP